MGATRSFLLISDWRIAAPRDAVWRALHEPCAWPRWWRYVKQVDELAPGDGEGVGARHRVHWTSRLPYAIRLETRVAEVRREALIRVEADGDVVGEGLWELAPREGGTDVRYTWRVDLGKAWMRALAPALRPVFAWNHDAIMAEGELGLRRLLHAPG